MPCYQTWLISMVMGIIINLVGLAHAQNEVLSDAPKYFRLYANHLKSNCEKIKTLKGELDSSIQRPVNAAVFYRDRGNQLGVEEISVTGDFIREDSEIYKFTWDLTSNNLVSIGAPSDKPCRYLNAETNKEVVPKHKNNVIGAEMKTVIDSKYAIFTSFEKRTAQNGQQIYERTQNYVHGMRGSPKTLFFWTADKTYHEMLFAFAKQIEDKGETVGVCFLSIEKDLHALELIAKSKKTGDPLTYKWVFDASLNFALIMYECKIGALKNVTTHEWTYSLSEVGGPVATQLTTTIVENEKVSRREVHKLSKLVVNEKLADDVFSLASLGPSNGDVLVDNESRETFIIQDLGRTVVSTDITKNESSTNVRVIFIAINLALVVGIAVLLVVRRMSARGIGS